MAYQERQRFQSIMQSGEIHEGKQSYIFCENDDEYRKCRKILVDKSCPTDIYKFFQIHTNRPKDVIKYGIGHQVYIAIKNYGPNLGEDLRKYYNSDIYNLISFNDL